MSVPANTRWLSAAARATPHAPAAISGSAVLTYHQLAGAAARWAEQLADVVSPARPARVGIVARRTLAAAAQLWAVWESPHTAVLLEPASPIASDAAQLAAWGVCVVLDGEELLEIESSPPQAATGQHTWILTSGSTGAPRPVILTEANVSAAVAASQRRIGNDAADRWQLVLPPVHVGGASVLWRSAAAGGAVILDEDFDPVRTAQRLGDGAITVTSLVPTMLYRLLDALDEVSPEVRAVLVGGAATSDRLLRRALDAGLPVVTTYGLTEACSQVATVEPGEMEPGFGTVGRPLDGMLVGIEEPDEVGVGVITVDGPAVFAGYVGEPARSGPHRTGDLGRLDEAGRLAVLGRRDEVIVTGGKNVFPAVVERALDALPEVQQAAVVGVADEEWGQAIVACVVPAGAVEATELASRVRDRLRPAERPKQYRFLEALPELPNGKVDRSALQRDLETRSD